MGFSRSDPSRRVARSVGHDRHAGRAVASKARATEPGGMRQFRASIERQDRITLLTFSGELDLAGTHDAWAALEGAASARAPVVIDLRSLRFIDAAGLRVLVRAHALLGARLWLLAPAGIAARVFQITGLADQPPFVSARPAPAPQLAHRPASVSGDRRPAAMLRAPAGRLERESRRPR